MELQFGEPWLVFGAVALLFCACGVFAWKRRIGAGLFVLAGAAFFLGGSRPAIGQVEPEVRHALVVDVSPSMRSRVIDDFIAAIEETDLPVGHFFVRYELSDALRNPGGIRGEQTRYARLGDFTVDEDINGEVLFVTDGRGDFSELHAAVAPSRLILLPAPTPEQPDAAILDLQAPMAALPGSTIQVRGTLVCDRDASVPWKLLANGETAASGTSDVRANTPQLVSHALLAPESNLQRFTLQLDLPGDREAGNDEAETQVTIGGKRKVAYCVPKGIPADTDALLQNLIADERNNVTIRHDLPATESELDGVALVVINNLPLGGNRQSAAAIADWVNDGGSLIMVGTDGAYGPGGYRNSAIEAVMPVRFRPDDSPPRRTLLLLDVSQSMEDRLSGGETKLQRMKEAARRFQQALGEDDQAAVVGFREGLASDIRFLGSGSEALTATIDALSAQGSTHIRTSLAEAVAAVTDETRILMITDGEEVEGASAEAYRTLGTSLTASKIRLDVVLTTPGEKLWVVPLKDGGGDSVSVWSVGGQGFDGLIQTLDRAIAGADKEWVLTEPVEASGAGTPIPRLVRTALRADESVVCPVLVEQPSRYPVVSQRTLVGRTVAICTDSWGGEPTVQLWLDGQFRKSVDAAIEFALENASETRLVLNSLNGGAELVWTGKGEPPLVDLRTDTGTARLDTPGRWLLDEMPEGDVLRVFNGDKLIQRIPLPRLVPPELRYTGNDNAFFSQADSAGIRVLSGLASWKPKRFGKTELSRRDITWVPALLAMLLLIGGFATRRR